MGLRYLGNIIKPGYNPLASNITTGVNTAQYQGVFTLQQQAQAQNTQSWATDPLFENTTLLLQSDNAANGSQNNTFLDSSSNSFSITRNGNTTQGTFTPFSQAPGWWSNYFDGSGDYLLTALTGRSLGTGSFTVQCYFNISALTSGYILISSTRTAGGSDGTSLTVDSATQKITITTSGTVLYTGRTVVKTNQWYHLAYVRNGSSACSVYVDGVLDGTFTDARNFSGTQLLIGGGEGGNAELNGYISNYSITNTAVYTAAFTPPNIPTTSAVVILTCQSNRFVDNSGNNFTFTIGGTPSVQAFSPFAPQYQWTAPVIGGSGYFDGTGDYLSIADNAAFDFGSGDFTIECWTYMTSAAQQFFIGQWNSPQRAWAFLVKNSGTTLSFVYSTTGSNEVQVDGTIAAQANRWAHFAAVRNGNTLKTYMNGVEIGSASVTGVTFFNASQAIEVGRNPEATTTWNLTGYAASMRVVKGTAVYTGAFTPPIAPVTTSGPASSYSSTTNVNTTFTSTNTSLLLNCTNAGIFDGTMKNNLETVGNAQISTAVVKYGSGSMYFDGSGDYLYMPSTATTRFASSNWTIEFWFYTALPTTRQIMLSWNAISSGYAACSVNFLANGKIGLQISESGSTWKYDDTTTGIGNSLSANTWYHLSVTRIAQTITVYINGVSIGTYSLTSASTSLMTNDTRNVVGISPDLTNQPFSGYLDDIRITTGIARYTSNFIPPSVALPRQ